LLINGEMTWVFFEISPGLRRRNPMADKPQDKEQGERKRGGRGFAGMDRERQRQIASEGGRAAHQQGRAHEFTPEEAREAGRKGGMASGGGRRRKAQAAAGLTSRNVEGNSPEDQAGPQDVEASRTEESESA
jgi:uncharacterized protein